MAFKRCWAVAYGIGAALVGTLLVSPAAVAEDNATAFSEIVAAFDLPAADQEQLQANFDELSTSEQSQLLSELNGNNPLGAFEIGTAETSTEVTAPEGRAARAATYTVTSTNSFPFVMLGVTTGYFNQKYVYQTGSGKVLQAYSCDGWFSGFSGTLSVSASSNQWVSGGEGNCRTRFSGSLFIKGTSVVVNKEMLMVVNGPGIKGTSLKNV